MKCIIPGVDLKVFGKAVQSLAKIGDEISLEPTFNGLELKSVNSTRSGLAVFLLSPSFFQHYDDGTPKSTADSNMPTCRLTSKSLLNVFKSLSGIEKLVESCTISLTDKQPRVKFQLHCKHGLTKTFNLAYMEAESLTCAIGKGSCANRVKADAVLFSDIIGNFHSHMEEITFIASSESMVIRNYVDEAAGDVLNGMSTVMSVNSEEFDEYSVQLETSISFCVKEFKAAVAFAEYTGASITMHFNESSKPLFICMDSNSNYEATFIIATVADEQSATQNSQTSQRVVSDERDKIGKQGESSIRLSRANLTNVDSHTGGKLQYNESQGDASEDISCSRVEVKHRLLSLMEDSTIPLLTASVEKSVLHPCQQTQQDEIDKLLKEINDETKSTIPPSKKFKSAFFGLDSTNSQNSAEPLLDDEILAEDSDDG